jgi:hypothetical protein
MIHSMQTFHLSWITSSWTSSPGGSIECVQNDFGTYGTSSTNHAPILHRHKHRLQTERSEIPHDPSHLGVPSGASKMISEQMVRLAQTLHLLAPTVTLSPKTKKWDSIWPMSPKNSIGCVQNDFHSYGTFNANHAPILYHFHLSLVT